MCVCARVCVCLRLCLFEGTHFSLVYMKTKRTKNIHFSTHGKTQRLEHGFGQRKYTYMYIETGAGGGGVD